MPVVEITVSCHIESRGRHRRRGIPIWNQRQEQAGAVVGPLPRTKKNVLLQGGTKYRFDLSNGKSYHLHTTGLFTPGLWLKCELNHRTLQPPGDFARRSLSPTPSPLPFPPRSSPPLLRYRASLPFLSLPRLNESWKTRRIMHDTVFCCSAVTERRGMTRRNKQRVFLPSCFKILKCVISWCLRYCIVMDPARHLLLATCFCVLTPASVYFYFNYENATRFK